MTDSGGSDREGTSDDTAPVDSWWSTREWKYLWGAGFFAAIAVWTYGFVGEMPESFHPGFGVVVGLLGAVMMLYLWATQRRPMTDAAQEWLPWPDKWDVSTFWNNVIIGPGLPEQRGEVVVATGWREPAWYFEAPPEIRRLGPAGHTVVSRSPQRLELTRTRLRWFRNGGDEPHVDVPWADVVEIDAYRHHLGEGDVELGISIRLRPPEQSSPTRRFLRARLVPELDRFNISVVQLGADPRRLYWACIAFADPARREALLAGKELAAVTG